MFKRKLLCVSIAALSLCAVTSFAVEKKAKKESPAKKNQLETKSQKAHDYDVGEIKSDTVDLQAQIKNDVPHLGVNINVYGGYNFADWSSFTSSGHGGWALIGGIRPRNNSKGGYTIGGDLGYQVIRYFGIELGYYYFKKVSGDDLSIQTPYFYGAAKVSYPFLANDDLSIFAKLGVALREIEYGGGAKQGVYNNKRYSIRPVYGLGIQYYISHRWKTTVQWLEIPEYTSGSVNSKNSSKQVPRTDQVLIGLGYLFSI